MKVPRHGEAERTRWRLVGMRPRINHPMVPVEGRIRFVEESMVLPGQVCGKRAALVKLLLNQRRRCEDSSASEESRRAQSESNRVWRRIGVAAGAGADRIDQITPATINGALIIPEPARIAQRRDGEASIHVRSNLIGVPRKSAHDITCVEIRGERDRRRKINSSVIRYRVLHGRNGAQVSVNGLEISARHPTNVRPNHHRQLLGSSGPKVLTSSQHLDELFLCQLETRRRVRC